MGQWAEVVPLRDLIDRGAVDLLRPHVYVEPGTHRLLADPADPPPDADPTPDIVLPPAEVYWSISDDDVIGYVAVAAGVALLFSGPGLLAAMLLLLLILLVLWLLESLEDLFTDPPRAIRSPDRRPADPAITAAPSDTTTAVAGADPENPRGINPGDLYGRGRTSCHLQVIYLLGDLADEPAVRAPAWWHYSGRWGVKVQYGDGRYASGMRRTDGYGRSWAYHHAAALWRHL